MAWSDRAPGRAGVTLAKGQRAGVFLAKETVKGARAPGRFAQWLVRSPDAPSAVPSPVGAHTRINP